MVAMTGRKNLADGRHVKACGFDDCLLKPVSISELQRVFEMFSE